MEDLETPTVVEMGIGKMILKDVVVSVAVTAIAMGLILGAGYIGATLSDRKAAKKLRLV